MDLRVREGLSLVPLWFRFPVCVPLEAASAPRPLLPPPPPPPSRPPTLALSSLQELAEELCKVCDGRPVTMRPGRLEVKGNFKPEVMAWLLRLGF